MQLKSVCISAGVCVGEFAVFAAKSSKINYMKGAKCKIDTVLPHKTLVLLDPLVVTTRCFFMAGVSHLFLMGAGSECSDVKLFSRQVGLQRKAN